mmetsp:Transcript_15545/g.25559  ORF Transcript_15545/g.25559 Transcript_15545/m.25559 type:complete len:227 (+) Transcript_15545:2234-2914(+)
MIRHQDNQVLLVITRQNNLTMTRQGNPVRSLAHILTRNPCPVNRARLSRNLQQDLAGILLDLWKMMTGQEVSSPLLAQGVDDLRDLGILKDLGFLRGLGILVRILLMMMAQEASNLDLQRDRGILGRARMLQEVDILQVETTQMTMTPEGNPQSAQEVGVPGGLRTRVPIILRTAPEVEGRGVRTQLLNSPRGNRARTTMMNRCQIKRRSRSCHGSSWATSEGTGL